ncbi:hypothetical protein CRENBAI_023564 [Crenichthys baileyi]|uniref:Uncharacterized protein n=1 Tax=Crenichthys baileyi TaxID=28760 RepID=A0AAV9QVU0_9TELE
MKLSAQRSPAPGGSFPPIKSPLRREDGLSEVLATGSTGSGGNFPQCPQLLEQHLHISSLRGVAADSCKPRNWQRKSSATGPSFQPRKSISKAIGCTGPQSQQGAPKSPLIISKWPLFRRGDMQQRSQVRNQTPDSCIKDS